MPLIRDDDEERKARLDRLLERARRIARSARAAVERSPLLKRPAKASLDRDKPLPHRKKP
jgi:hypothetical protein